MISPNILRLLLYRVIRDEISISPSYNYEGFVEVLNAAGLWKGRDSGYHPIFPNEYNKRIYLKGYCTTCKRAIRFPDGTAFAINTHCIGCFKKEISGDKKYPRLYCDLIREFYRWEDKYQDECLEFLITGGNK